MFDCVVRVAVAGRSEPGDMRGEPVTPGVRRALLMSCSLGTLPGAEHSVDTMATHLAARGFECRVLRDAETTRAGVKAALGLLAAQTGERDLVTIYYAGHGYARALASPDGRTTCTFVLATADMRDSTATKFRGIVDAELREWLGVVAMRTSSIAVVLDCCHAAAMVPGGGEEVSGAALRSMQAQLGTLVEEACKRGSSRGRGDLVYVVSSASPEIANEAKDRQGRPIYAFTDRLVRTLEQVGGAPVNWDEVVFAATAQMAPVDAIQRPGVGGRRWRRIFGFDDIKTDSWLGAVTDERTIVLRGGSAMTLAVGDRLLVEPLVLGTHQATMAVVTEVDALRAVLVRPSGAVPDPPVVRAIRIGRARLPVVRLVGEIDAALRRALETAPFTVVDGAGDGAIATLRGGDGLTLYEGEERLVYWPASATDVAALIEWVSRIEACRALADCGRNAPTPAFRVEVTLDDEGGPMLADGATLAAGVRLRVRIHNDDRYHALYFAVYRLTADRAIDLLARHTAQGLCALPREYADCRDVLLSWPAALDRALGERGETVVVLASHDPLLGIHEVARLGKILRGRPASSQVRTVLWQLWLRPDAP